MKAFTLKTLFIAALTIFTCSVSTTVAADSEPAPDFLVTTDAGQLGLEDLKGKVVYLDFWASWCVPCRASFKWLNEMHARYADQGLVILAINVDEEPALAKEFLADHPAAFRIAYDHAGKVAQAYALKGMPSSYLVDQNGKLHHTHVGFREKDTIHLEAHITALLNEHEHVASAKQ